ncbi:MAG TPA: PilZ domain-containing protein [Hyphomicrobiaceae bacterium]|nr:PilZ domain-containing protein [Hyphomicrobiaceae bacterium]
MTFDRLKSRNDQLMSRLAKIKGSTALTTARRSLALGAPPKDAVTLEAPVPESRTASPAAEPEPEMAQKRRTPRRRGEIPCTIQFDGLRMTLSARIIDMSAGGARLHLPPAAKTAYGGVRGLPDRLTLQIKSDRMEYEGAIAWRSESEIGVRFVAPPRQMKVQATAPTTSPVRSAR